MIQTPSSQALPADVVFFVNKLTCKMAFLGLRPRDKVAVLAFRRICMAKKIVQFPVGENAFVLRVHNV